MLFDQGIDIPASLMSESLTVELSPERVRWNLRIKPNDVAAVKKASGLKLPAKIGTVNKAKDQLITKFGPDEWVVADSPKAAVTLTKTMVKLSKNFVISATDISHRNIGFKIFGPKAAEAVNVGCPLDLSLKAFPTGKATRTVFENAPIQLYRAGATEFHIECWRSFGPYLRDFISAYSRDI